MALLSSLFQIGGGRNRGGFERKKSLFPDMIRQRGVREGLRLGSYYKQKWRLCGGKKVGGDTHTCIRC